MDWSIAKMSVKPYTKFLDYKYNHNITLVFPMAVRAHENLHLRLESTF